VREAPVDGADADVGVVRDVVERHAQAALREQFGGGVEDPPAIALGVLAQGSFDGGHVTSVANWGDGIHMDTLVPSGLTSSAYAVLCGYQLSISEARRHGAIEPPPREALADPGDPRNRAADGGPRRHGREH